MRRRLRSRALRWTRNALLALLALVVLVLGGVHIWLLTVGGRGYVLARVVPLLSDALGGPLAIDRLDSLSAFGLRARGVRLQGPNGALVASVGTLDAGLSPLELVFGKVHVTRLEVDDVFVDLGAPADEGGGLLGLFAPKPEDEKEPDESGGSGPDILLDGIAVRGGRLSVKLDGQLWQARALALSGALAVREQLALRVARIDAELLREGRSVGAIEASAGSYDPARRSHARLDLRVAESRLLVRGQLDALDSRGAQPLRAWVRGRNLGRSTLAALGLEAEKDWPLSPIDLQLNGSGDTSTLQAQLSLTTGVETLQARAQWAAPSGLRIDPLTARWPGAVLRARGDLAIDGGFAGDVSIDARQLARSPALARLVPGIAGALAADVHVERSAAGMLDGQVDIALSRGGVGENRVRSLHIAGQVHGRELARMQGRVAIDATELNAGPAKLERSRVVLRGEPGSFALEGRFSPRGVLRAQAEHAQGTWTIDAALDLPLTALNAQALAPSERAGANANRERLILTRPRGAPPERKPEQTVATATEPAASEQSASEQTSKDADAKPVTRSSGVLHARLQQLQVAPSGRIAVKRLELAYQDARAVLSGELDPGHPEQPVQLEASVVVPRLTGPSALALAEPLHGSLRLNASASGPLRAPRVDLDASYRCPALEGLRNVALDLDVDADLRARRVQAKTQLRADGTSARLEIDSRAPGLTMPALRRARHAIALEIERLPLHALERWPTAPVVPDTVVLAGHFKAEGTLTDYSVDSALRARARFSDSDSPLDAWVNAKYGDQHLELGVRVSDRQGPLLRTAINTDLEGPKVALDRASFERLIGQRAWEATLSLAARRIDELPLTRALGVPEAMWPARVSADFKLAHDPGREPIGELTARAAWDPPGKQTLAPLCGTTQAPYVAIATQMRDGQLHGQVTAGSAGRDTLAVTLASHAPVNEWLQVKPEQVRPVSAKARFTDLELGNVPVVCEQVRGRVGGRAELTRALTKDVSVTVSVQGKRLVFIDAPPIDVAIDASAKNNQLLAKGTLASPTGGKAVLDAQIPLDGGGRAPTLSTDTPLRVDLKLYDVPAPALVASVPNVRASSGTLGGWLGLRGTVVEPDLRGRIDLKEVTMTLGELGQRFERASGTIAIADRRLELRKLTFGDLGGRATLSGDLTLIQLDPLKLNAHFDVKAKSLPIRRNGVMAAHLDGRLHTTIKISPELIDVFGSLRKARIELADAATTQPQSLEPNPDITFSDAAPEEAEQEVAGRPATALRVRIDASQPFWVRRSDFSALVSTDLKIEVNEGTPQVIGAVKIERGIIELLGQLFDIERGKIEFTGGAAIEPTLDLAASRRIPGGGALVRVEAHGSVHEPELTFQIDGRAATAGEALAAAMGTRQSSGGDSDVQEEISSLATGIAGSVLTLAARRELGPWVPVLAVEQGGGETRVRAGVEADRFIPGFLRKVVVDAYVEGIVSQQEQTDSGQVTTNEAGTGAAVLLELRFPHDFTTEAQYGPGQRWSFDLGWEP